MYVCTKAHSETRGADQVMEFYEKPGHLIFVQVDHISGEILGEAWERLYSRGAKNMQIIPSLTKKGRPGQLMILDVFPERLPDVGEYLVVELGVSGWHCLSTSHMHVETETLTVEALFISKYGRKRMKVVGKRIKGVHASIRAEHSECVLLQNRFAVELNVDMPLREVAELMKRILDSESQNLEIELKPTWEEDGMNVWSAPPSKAMK